ncbi:MAG TPA: hypothetical protein VK787_01770 [Puia sp.]|jgi:hypothetical protein|nr:hypothetical protein [Puia sp.]
MKKALIYIVLFSYTLIIIRPTVPIIADIIAHTFWYSQHIATVHFENGKYHVHYQSMNEAQKSFPGKNPQNSKTETFIADHLIKNQKFDFTFFVINNKCFKNLCFSIPDMNPSHNYPPPKSLI